jgi:hypothetical protein
MGRTRTSGILTDAEGNKIVNKQVFGRRIFGRLGPIGQDAAERWLAGETERIKLERQSGTRPRVTFRQAAARHLRECIGKAEHGGHHRLAYRATRSVDRGLER